MRQLVSRYTEPLLARIPDYSADPLRKQAAVGLVASVLVHLFLFLLFVILIWLFPKKAGYEFVKEDAPLEIEIVPPKDPAEAEQFAAFQKKRQVLSSRGLQESAKKPENAEFESDQDMVAGSELPATGLLPLPSQDGRTDIPTLDFATQDVILGASEDAAGPLLRGPKGNEPPRPLYKPLALTQAQIAAANDAGPSTALPQVSATPPPRFEERLRPAATPAPSRNVPLPAEGELVLSTQKPTTPAPVPKPDSEKKTDLVEAPITRAPMATPAPQMASLSTPPPAVGGSFRQRYQEHMEKARIEGNISNRGRPGVSAERTPLGVYKRNISNLISSRWQFYVDERRDLISIGSVRLRFKVTSEGRVENVVVEANDSNRNLENISVQAVRESKLPPLPADVVTNLNGEQLEIVFTFNLY